MLAGVARASASAAAAARLVVMMMMMVVGVVARHVMMMRRRHVARRQAVALLLLLLLDGARRRPTHRVGRVDASSGRCSVHDQGCVCVDGQLVGVSESLGPILSLQVIGLVRRQHALLAVVIVVVVVSIRAVVLLIHVGRAPPVVLVVMMMAPRQERVAVHAVVVGAAAAIQRATIAAAATGGRFACHGQIVVAVQQGAAMVQPVQVVPDRREVLETERGSVMLQDAAVAQLHLVAVAGQLGLAAGRGEAQILPSLLVVAIEAVVLGAAAGPVRVIGAYGLCVDCRRASAFPAFGFG